MCELQAVIEFSIALNKFINVDLFNRGCYQIRLTLRVASKGTHKIEVGFADPSLIASPTTTTAGTTGTCATASSATLSHGECNSSQSNIVFPQCIVNGSAVSKTFQILYKNEEVVLNDVVVFKANLIVDANDCITQVNKTSFLLDVELWFSDQEFGVDQHNSIECVSTRQLVLHFDICRGLHYYLPIMFDYFHLSTLTLSVHASLITLCQPYLNRVNNRIAPKNDKKVANNVHAIPINSCTHGYEALLFGGSSNVKSNDDVMSIRYRRAQLIHWQLISILFAAIQSLKRKLDEYFHLLPPWQQSKCLNLSVNISLDNLSKLAQECYKSIVLQEFKGTKNFISFQNESLIIDELMKPEEFVAAVESDMAYLCGVAIVEWHHFLSVVSLSHRINQHLAKVHHMQRIKRFSEAFFCIEKQKRLLHSICDNNTAVFNEISESIRKSPYLNLLPSCDVECVALDGDSSSFPIIYEEKFDSELFEQKDINSASINEISLEDTFDNVLRYNEPSSTIKRNMREKILNNLSRFHFGNYGKLKEEYSPTAITASTTNLSRFDKNSNQSAKSQKESVILLGFRSLESSSSTNNNNNNELIEKDGNNARLSDSLICASLSFNDIHSQIGKRIICSESLPDLSTKEVLLHIKKQLSTLPASSSKAINNRKPHSNSTEKSSLMRAIRPPSQFRDNHNEKSETKQMNAKDSKEMPFYPKPPKQFTIDESDEPEDHINSETSLVNSINGTEAEAINGVEMNISSNNANEIKDYSILELLKSNDCLLCGDISCECSDDNEELPSLRRVSAIGSDLVSFVRAKEDFRQQIASKSKGWLIYSDFPSLASRIPYFQCDSEFRSFSAQKEGLHLIICVHGLDGNSADLRLVKTYLELGLPTTNFEFLMSQRNQGETFDSLETLTDRLVQEINYHIEVFGLNPSRISFIGHSLGNIIIRAVLANHEFLDRWKDKLYTFLSLSGPHLGLAYNNSGLVNMGLWFMQKWKKSGSLLQLAMKDSNDPRQTYLYRLSLESGLEYFRNILLCGSSQDHYVPIHSAHIEICNSALNDSSPNGIAYREMVNNLLHPLMSRSSIKLIRYDVHHSLASNANALIGRAAHIAVLDSELFIEKFMVVTGLKYFV